MKWWRQRRAEREEERAEIFAWTQLNLMFDGLRVGVMRDPWAEFRHGPVDKAAMRGPIPPSANSISELRRADDLARRCCCRCCR